MKQNLLLLHGALGAAAQFNVLKDLLSSEFNIYTLNFSGHGGVETDAPFSIALFANDVLGLMQKENLDRVHIFGYSMGGYVALHLALHHPDSVESIVTLGTKFNWTREGAQKEVGMLNPDVIEQKVPHFAETLYTRHAPLDWKQNMLRTADMMLRLGNGEAMTEVDFRRISHRVCIGIGDADTMVTREESAHVAGLLPNGKLVVLEGVKHPIETVGAERLYAYVSTEIVRA